PLRPGRQLPARLPRQHHGRARGPLRRPGVGQADAAVSGPARGGGRPRRVAGGVGAATPGFAASGKTDLYRTEAVAAMRAVQQTPGGWPSPPRRGALGRLWRWGARTAYAFVFGPLYAAAALAAYLWLRKTARRRIPLTAAAADDPLVVMLVCTNLPVD